MTATVERIESWIVDVPTIRPHKLSMTTMGCQSLVIVRLTRSDGICGIGEATTIGGLSYGVESPEAISSAITHYLTPLLKGQPADNLNALTARMNGAIKGNTFAKSAIETALLDAQGKALGLPVSALLGGALSTSLPVLWTLSGKVTALPLIGAVPHSLVWVALAWSLGGTLLLACVGVKLPGLEFHNQRVEAAYRKELVLGEDDPNRASPPTAAELFAGVRRNYFRLFFHYLYFDVVKWSYLQVSVLVPLVALGPTLIAGVITLGVMQQIARAFDKVLESFQFLVLNWSTVVEQISIYKRLRAFEQQMLKAEPEAG